jgi:hypothetical protein
VEKEVKCEEITADPKEYREVIENHATVTMIVSN